MTSMGSKTDLKHSYVVNKIKPWNDDAGDWQHLAAASQIPRYEELARIISKFCPRGSVLDVGCGEAVLLSFLPRCTGYLGIEPSKKAAGAAYTTHGSNCIVNVTAEDFDGAQQQWDCVVFNEMLYYTAAPLRLIRKYAALLSPNGIIIISIFQRPDRGIRRRLLWWAWPGLVTNIRCTKMVYGFMMREGWNIEIDEYVSKPDAQDCWRIFAVKAKR
jgi:2-polyprenyl-3-methyl-5-hydroxy-6-metoxy-1,4-benzoquinol methylase